MSIFSLVFERNLDEGVKMTYFYSSKTTYEKFSNKETKVRRLSKYGEKVRLIQLIIIQGSLGVVVNE